MLERLRKGTEQGMRDMRMFGEQLRVTSVTATPVERRGSGLLCLGQLTVADAIAPQDGVSTASRPPPLQLEPFQTRLNFSVDILDGELITRWDRTQLFQVTMFAAGFAAMGQQKLPTPFTPAPR